MFTIEFEIVVDWLSPQPAFHPSPTGFVSTIAPIILYGQVGSAEGWTPATFTSSREKRAAPREQRPEDFMDDEDGLLTEQLQVREYYTVRAANSRQESTSYLQLCSIR